MFSEKNKSNIDTPHFERKERSGEYPVVGFDDYVEICNHNNDSSRRRGILSGEMYEDIIKDPNTGFIELVGRQVPVFMDVNNGIAMGYDAEKCKKYAEDLSENVKILTLPFHELNDDEKLQVVELIIAGGKCALYFSDHDDDESNALGEMLDKINIQHTETPLIDSRAARGDEQAAIFLYSCCAEQKSDRGERKKLSLGEVQDYYDKNVGTFYTPDGKTATTLSMGDKISDQQAEEMWLIYDSMFDFLGEDHPISMQDSKEDFFKLMRSNSVMVAATYDREENDVNKLVCFTYFHDDMSKLYWLNQKLLNEKADSSNSAEYITNIFTPGIVSAGVGRSYASLPISVFAKAGDEAGLSTNIFYENTNLSKRYIPRIVDRTMKNACAYTTLRPSEVVDTINYRLWAIGGGDV